MAASGLIRDYHESGVNNDMAPILDIPRLLAMRFTPPADIGLAIMLLGWCLGGIPGAASAQSGPMLQTDPMGPAGGVGMGANSLLTEARSKDAR